MLFWNEMKSPVGKLKLVAESNTVVAILWENERPGRVAFGAMTFAPAHPLLIETERQLHEYFSGARTRFDLPVELRGSEFQKKVWHALSNIPFGETRSYTDLARALGSAKACRAVGAANGRNPLAIVVPCHRVIGANGALSGFAAGLEAKTWLLAFEAEIAAAAMRSAQTI